MAYRTRRSTSRATYRRSPARRSSAPRRGRSGGRRSAPAAGSLRIIVETQPASAVARPDMAPLVRKPTSGKAKL